MARPVDTARRAELLDQTLQYLFAHGLSDFSLRSLAEELGTSARMLVHYFGSKETLVAQALTAARPDVDELVASAGNDADTLAAVAGYVWRDMVGGGLKEARIRLMFEIMALALAQPDRYGVVARDAVQAWVTPVARALRRAGHSNAEARARATALVSGLRGIALDRYLTGDRARTDAAAERVIALATGGPGAEAAQ